MPKATKKEPAALPKMYPGRTGISSSFKRTALVSGIPEILIKGTLPMHTVSIELPDGTVVLKNATRYDLYEIGMGLSEVGCVAGSFALWMTCKDPLWTPGDLDLFTVRTQNVMPTTSRVCAVLENLGKAGNKFAEWLLVDSERISKYVQIIHSPVFRTAEALLGTFDLSSARVAIVGGKVLNLSDLTTVISHPSTDSTGVFQRCAKCFRHPRSAGRIAKYALRGFQFYVRIVPPEKCGCAYFEKYEDTEPTADDAEDVD